MKGISRFAWINEKFNRTKKTFLRVYFESCITNKFSNFVSEIEESVKHETANFEDNINC